MNPQHLRLAWTWALAALTLAGCAAAPHSGPQAVQIHFAAHINGVPFECGRQYPGVGTTGSTLTPMDYRFYVSAVHLIDHDGRAVPVELEQDAAWQHQNVALLDFENGQGACRNGTAGLNTSVRGTVPAGRYQGVEFTLGLPFHLNHADPTTAPAPLNNTAMFWNWQGGYKFLKFDTATSGISDTSPGAAKAQGPVTRYAVHLGSTSCTAASRTSAPAIPCGQPNTLQVRLPAFDATRHTVVADIGRVLARTNVDVNAPQTSPGCMSFPKDADCPGVMAALGLAYDGVAAPATGQQLFSVR